MATDREIKNARKTLKGLEHTCGMVGFDYVQDRYPDLPEMRLRQSGTLRYVGGEHVKRRSPGNTGYSQFVHLAAWKAKGERSWDSCPWIRLKHAADWQIEQFIARWPSRRIAFHSYVGHGQTRWVTVPVFPLDVVAAWMRFVWPDTLDFGECAEKYLVGFTDKYVHDFPGIGAKVKIIQFAKAPPAVLGASNTGPVVGKIEPPWFEVDVGDGREPVVIGAKTDLWEILD